MRHGSKKSASTLTLLQSSSSAFKVFSSPLQHATSLIFFFYLGPPCISLDLNLCLSQTGNGIFNCSLLTDFRGIPDLPLGRNILGLSLTTGAFTQQLPMFTSISEFDPGRDAGYDTGYDAGYDAALLVLSFPCAAFPFLFPLQVTIFHAPLSLETPTPSWIPLFIFSIFNVFQLSCISAFCLSAGSTSIIQSAMENLTTPLSLHAMAQALYFGLTT